MRVVAGELRGRRIEGPNGDATRPTTDKVREAVFNALGSLGVVDGATVVDLFAGSGALGIEAISRGALVCTFVENDRSALATLKSNVAALGITEKSSVITFDIAREISAPGGGRIGDIVAHADLVLVDPPYGFAHWPALFEVLGMCAENVVVVAETESRSTIHANPPAGWKCLRSREYGRTTVGFFAREQGIAEGH